MQYERITWVAKDTRRVQLAKRAYDAIFLWLGMNVMFVPPNREYVKDVVTELRTAIPNVPILLMGPGDTVREGEKKSDPRIVSVSKQIREVAAELGVGFWDFREAMGGDGAVIDFTHRGLTGEDHIHFGPEGSHLMGDRLLCSMSSAFSKHVTEHPQAGCPSTAVTTADAGTP